MIVCMVMPAMTPKYSPQSLSKQLHAGLPRAFVLGYAMYCDAATYAVLDNQKVLWSCSLQG